MNDEDSSPNPELELDTIFKNVGFLAMKQGSRGPGEKIMMFRFQKVSKRTNKCRV